MKIIIGLVVCLTCVVAAAQETHLPYYCRFETAVDTAGWKLTDGVSSSKWCWGEAENRSGNRSIYLSTDGGATAGYDEVPTGYYVVAYKKFTVKAMQKYDLAFDCKVWGEKTRTGNINDGMMAAWIPASKGVPVSGTGGADFPMYAKQYKIKFDDGRDVFSGNGWSNVACTVSAFEPEYYLVFVWKTNGVNVKGTGAAIDNVQLAPQYADCARKPLNMKYVQGDDMKEFTVTWSGNADEYELQYYRNGVRGAQPAMVKNMTSTSYTVKLGDAAEGVYSVLVRSICGSDTSVWCDLSDAFIYDKSAHCVDYLNLHSDDVVCTSGTFQNPYLSEGVVDNGYYSAQSIHTIHYVRDEYDPRTGNKLRTVPEDAVASVRISNWQEQPAGSASISYKYHVTDEADVLKVRYAAVLQYPPVHVDPDQTRIIVEVFDAVQDTLLSECARSEFNAAWVSENKDKIREWNEYPKENQPDGLTKDHLPIMWCDWSLIGINLQEYVGRDLNIRITLKACGANFHFAYAYFILDCDKGEVTGISCGEHPNVFRVPEGFLYRWYQLKDPTVTIGTADSLVIQPADTAKYGVDLIFPENEQCYFTLKASALPRAPIADMGYEVEQRDCHNVVKLKNFSKVFGFWEGDTIATDEYCRFCVWDLKEYGVSIDFEPEFIVPAQGDTFDISLAASVDKTMECIDTKSFVIRVPSIESDTTFVNYGICEGHTVTHDGKEYSGTGREILHYDNRFGCDSVVVLDISIITLEREESADTVCSGERIDFYGRWLSETGHYEDTLISRSGCDSVIRTMDLVVRKPIDVRLKSDTIAACADDASFVLEYDNVSGFDGLYGIKYSEKAKAAGFEDIESAEPGSVSSVTIGMQAGITPDRYDAVLTFYNDTCGNLNIPFTVSVLYPSSVIAQRWNDVLALQNADYNGGYKFVAYQWYKDGEPMEGEIRSILYRPADMDYAATYTMLLTRITDGVSAFTCGITPVEFSDEDIKERSSITFSDGSISLVARNAGIMYVYGFGGQLIVSSYLHEGENRVALPAVAGMYVVKIVYEDGVIESRKIVACRH